MVETAATRIRLLAALPLLLVITACESPEPPAPCGPLADRTVAVGEAATVTACFDDPNGDVLSYAATSSDPSVATASISGTSVTVMGVAPGGATVTVTASDPDGMQAQSRFAVTVPNRAPEARGAIEPITVAVGDTATMDVAAYFSEPDGETLTYSAASSDASAASAAARGSTVAVAGVARGTADITVTATDPGGLAATQSFAATVPNRGPGARGEIPALTIEAGDTVSLDMTPYFGDPDGDSLAYSAAASETGVATAAAAGNTVTVTAVARGTAIITVTATDPGGLSASQSFTATVPNRAPEARGEIPAAILEAGDTLTLEMSPYFSDPDGDTLTYAATASQAGVFDVAATGGTITLAALARGAATIAVTATDPGGLTATQSFQATVANRAPEARGQIPALTIEAGDTVWLDMTPYFGDPDGDSLAYSAAASETGVATAAAAGNTVTVTAVARGAATITVTATDPDGLAATQSFTATVPNRAPEARGEIPAATLEVGDTLTLDMSPYFSDPDGDTLTYAATASRAGIFDVAATGGTVTLEALARGAATITVTATDPGGLSATQSFTATVPNRAPEARDEIPAATLEVGDTLMLEMSPYFSDPDGDTLTYAATASRAGIFDVAATGGAVTLEALARGAATIAVTATDPGGLAASQSFTATVANRAPEARDEIPAATLEVGDTLTLEMSPYFSDPDGDTLTYAATASQAGVFDVAATGGTIALEALARGAATITVTATDPGGLAATQSFQATVPNRAPEARGEIPAATLEVGDTLMLEMSPYFSDPDGDSLAYSAATSESGVATAAAAGNTVTVTALARGAATITVTAADPGGLAATQSFTATVANRAPEARGEIPAATLEAGDTLMLEMSPYFSDPDGDTLTYAATASQAGVFDVAATGGTITLAALARGAATIAVTATDPGGLSATQSFTATVPNRAPEARDEVPAFDLDPGHAAELNVVPFFGDPDGDALNYAATTSDPDVATASATDSTIAVTAVAPGTATLTVTARDPEGLEVSQSAGITVRTPVNRSPVAVGSIPGRFLAPGAVAVFDVSRYFGDPDGDSLAYTAGTSMPQVATAAISGDTVTIAGVATGDAVVTITAGDPGGLTATQQVEVYVDAGYFVDDFDTNASLENWVVADAGAEARDSVLHLTNRRENRQGLIYRDHPLTEWVAGARLGRADTTASVTLVLFMKHDRYTAYAVQIGSGIEVDGEDTNYRFQFFDADRGIFVRPGGFQGKSDAVKDGAGEFTEISFSLIGRQLELNAGTTRLFISEPLSTALPVEIEGYWLSAWPHDGSAGRTVLFDWFEIEGDAVSGDIQARRSRAADLVRRLAPAGDPDRVGTRDATQFRRAPAVAR